MEDMRKLIIRVKIMIHIDWTPKNASKMFYCFKCSSRPCL